MTPAEWTVLANAAGALLTALIVAVSTALLQRQQARKITAETDAIRAEVAAVKHEVTPNSGSSSHDALVRRLDHLHSTVEAVRELQEVQGDLISAHVAESTADRALLHAAVEGHDQACPLRQMRDDREESHRG